MRNAEHSLIASLVHLLVKIFEAPPAVEVVPEVVEALDSLLRVVVRAKHWNRLLLAEARLALENVPESLEKGLLWVPRLGDLRRGRNIILIERRVNGIELTAPLGVGEDLERLLDALKERIVVGIAHSARFLVRVVLKNLFPVYGQTGAPYTSEALDGNESTHAQS